MLTKTREDITNSIHFPQLLEEYKINQHEIQEKKDSLLEVLNKGESLNDTVMGPEFVDNITEVLASYAGHEKISKIYGELARLVDYDKLLFSRITEMIEKFMQEFDRNKFSSEQILQLGSLINSFHIENTGDPMMRMKIERLDELETPLKQFESQFSTRLYNCLHAGDFDTLGDIVRVYKKLGPEKFVKNLRNFGKDTLEELELFLQKRGFIEERSSQQDIYHR